MCAVNTLFYLPVWRKGTQIPIMPQWYPQQMNPVLILTVVLKAWLHLLLSFVISVFVNFLLHLTGSSPITSSQLVVCELLLCRVCLKNQLWPFCDAKLFRPVRAKGGISRGESLWSQPYFWCTGRNDFLTISNIQRHLQVCSDVLQSRAGKVREVTLCILSKS